MTERAFERVFLETSLRKALEEDELVVYFQPQIDATDNKLVGMEALVR
jgi:sensor c-di-GMP phosphodiesterase-like protein